MDLQDIPEQAMRLANDTVTTFRRIPGSAILVRYVKSSYQNDPVRSAVELFLFLFALRYLLSPKYSTTKAKKVELTEHVRVWLELRKGYACAGVDPHTGDRRAGGRMDTGTACCR